MEAREPPEGRYIFQNKRELVAAEKNVEGGFVVEAVIEYEANVLVLFDDGAVVVGAIQGADEIEAIAGVGRNFKESFGLIAGGFVAADHVEVDHGARAVERTQRVGG